MRTQSPTTPPSTEALRRIDPVNGDAISRAWADSPAKAALLSEITARPIGTGDVEPAVVPLRRPRLAAVAPRLAVAAAVLTVAVTGVLIQGVTAPDPAYAVRQTPDGLVHASWSEDFQDGNGLAARFAEFGVDVEVVALPASPSAVGTVVSFATGPDVEGEATSVVPPGITYRDDEPGLTVDPSVYSGTLRLDIGVAPEGDEPYTVAEEAFEPGEVLANVHCTLGEPVQAADLATHIDQLGLAVIWEVQTPDPSRPDSANSIVVDTTPDGTVLHAYARDSQTVRVTVRPAGVEFPAGFGWEPRLSDVPCPTQ